MTTSTANHSVGHLRLCINWLPLSPRLTIEVARRAEEIGVWGLGIGDSPNYGELYAACGDALAHTSTLVVGTSVTNPVTRHWSIHASAARTFDSAYPNRFRLGIGRGDSAVHTFGLPPAKLADFEQTLATLHDAVPTLHSLVAASGPATARMAGRISDGLIAGVGADEEAVTYLARQAAGARSAGRTRPEVWASVRLAVGRSDADVEALRTKMLPRSISASHFAFASTFDGKSVPERFHRVLTERYDTYDYATHGKAGRTSNASMFADRPDIEDYLLDRFAVIGRPDACRLKLERLSQFVDGIYLSVIFEDVHNQLDLIEDVLRPP